MVRTNCKVSYRPFARRKVSYYRQHKKFYNTAPARLLASLPGITSKLAKNIANGVGSDKDKKLKPYKRLGDIMKVQGMSPEIFERCANLLKCWKNIRYSKIFANCI